MKIIKYLNILGAVVLLLPLAACEEDFDKKMISEDVAVSTVSEPDQSSYVLTLESENEVFNVFEWTASDFGFDASVTYTLQMDTAGGNWEKPVNLGSTQELNMSPTVSAINAALLGRGMEPEVSDEVKFRVMVTISPFVTPEYSNEVTANVTPYEVIFPPIFVIGDAQDWDLAKALELVSTGPGVYEGVGLFQEAGKFRLFATPSWDAEQWGWSFFEDGTIPAVLADGADDDSNFLFEGTTSVYKIIVDLNAQTITMEEGELPTLFIIGDAQDWDLANALSLAYLGGDRFEGTAEFQENTKFRLFEKTDWNATQYGYSYFAAGTIPAELSDGADNESNFLFTGPTGEYTITISLNSKAITLEAASEFPASLYIVGDDQAWSFTDELTATGEGVYEASATFTNGSTFRLFEEVDNWTDSFGAGYFTEGISADLDAAGDADDNFLFTGTTGVYTITISLADKTVTLEAGAEFPESLFIVGDDQEWSFSDELTATGEGVYEASATFTNGSTFRLFEEVDNWTDDFGAAYFTGGISADLAAAGDPDDNFTFVGTDGTYNITVDLANKTIALSQ